MGYPEDALAADGSWCCIGNPHWKMLVVPVTIFVLSAAIGGYLLGLAQRRLSDGASLVASAVIVVAWLALVVWKTLVPVLRWRSTHFIVTGPAGG